MNKKWQKLLCSTIVGIFFCKSVPVYGDMVTMRLLYDGSMHDYQAESIAISVNGTILSIEDMPPISLHDRTMVPARAVFEAMGAEVAWNEATQEVYVRKEKDIIVLKLDQTAATKNGMSFTMDVPAKVINERTMIPVRAVSEALGCDVKWDEATRTVSITEQEDLEQTNTAQTDAPQTDTEQTDTNQTDTEQADTNQTDTNQTDAEQTDTAQTDGQSPQKTYASGGTGNIPKENIGILSVTVPVSLQSQQIFTIEAGGEIAKFEQTEGEKDEIILDIYYAQKEILTDEIEVSTSPFVKTIVSSEFDKEEQKEDDVTVTRIVFELTGEPSYQIVLSDTKSTIVLSFEEQQQNTENVNQGSINQNHTEIDVNTEMPNNLKNIHYDSSKNALALKKQELFSVANIEHTDDYLHGKYQIVLPGDYSSIYGSGTMNLPNMAVPSVTVSQEQGKTALTFTQNSIRAYTMTEDGQYYYISVKNPKEVYDKVLLLDAGHGGADPGTNGNGLKEKDLNLSVLQRTYEKLQQTDKVKVYVTRIEDTYPENTARAEMANDIADVFISIHMNSASPNPTPNGTEALFITHETDVEGKLTSQTVATVLLKNMVNALGTNNRGLKYDTEEQKNLILLNRTTVPTVIIETLFLSNPGDAKKISEESYQQKAADAIYESVMELADNYVWR